METPDTSPASVPTGLETAEDAAETSPDNEISWTASEFVAHEKSAGWYAMLILVMLLVASLVYFITKDVVSVGVVIFGGILLGVYASHQPRQLQYQLDASGLTIGQKHYSYSEFRSFAILDEGAFSSIVFMPLKRFATLTAIYFDPKDEEKVVALLADRLPLEEHNLDAVDRLMRRVRF